MHKLTNATVEIIEAMVSNAYNGIRGKMILKKPTRVHQVKVSSSNTTIHQKLDVLASTWCTPIGLLRILLSPVFLQAFEAMASIISTATLVNLCTRFSPITTSGPGPVLLASLENVDWPLW